MSDTDRVIAAIERLQISVDRLPQAIARAVRRQHLAADSGAGLAAFAEVVSMELGNAVWTAAELLQHAKTNDDFRERVETSLSGVIPSARSLGARLADIVDTDLGGLRVERVGFRRGSGVWRVQRLKTQRATRKSRA